MERVAWPNCKPALATAWAEFQLACFAAGGELHPATDHFRRAAELATQTGEPFMLECIHSMESLWMSTNNSRWLRRASQQAYLESERVEKEHSNT